MTAFVDHGFGTDSVQSALETESARRPRNLRRDSLEARNDAEYVLNQ